MFNRRQSLTFSGQMIAGLAKTDLVSTAGFREQSPRGQTSPCPYRICFLIVRSAMADSFDNPFAIPANKGRNRLLTSLKGFAFIVVLFAIVVVLQSQTRQWLLWQWANGFAELPVGEQIERLLRINQLGDIATETLARRIAADNDSVAETAVDLIRERQKDWATRQDDELAAAHMQMLAGIEAIVDQLPANRVSWVTQLVNKTLIECVDQRGETMAKAYRAANDLLDRVADRTGIDNIARGEQFAPSLVPLPVRMQTIEETMEAVPVERNLAAIPIENATEVGATDSLATLESATAIAGGATLDEPQIVARSTSPVSRQSSPQPTIQPAINSNRVPNQAMADPYPVSIRGAEKMPLQTFSTRSVIGLLASNQASTRDQAVEELVRRGLSNEEIRIANQLAAPQLDVRLGLLDSIVRRSDIDPRPWLLWLAEDTSREVRVRAVTALQAMNDTAVSATLRKRLAVEEDPSVIALLKQLTERR